MINSFDKLTDDLKQNPRLLMYLSMAYLKTGNAKKAEEILLSDGGLVLLDFREGDKFWISFIMESEKNCIMNATTMLLCLSSLILS